MSEALQDTETSLLLTPKKLSVNPNYRMPGDSRHMFLHWGDILGGSEQQSRSFVSSWKAEKLAL